MEIFKRKFFKSAAVIVLVFILGFSNVPAYFFQKVGLPQVAEKVGIPEALAAAPNWQASSAIAASTGVDVTVTLPAHAADDILLLQAVVRNVANTAVVSGWISLGTVDRGTTSRYYWFWKRATSSAETNPLFDKSGTTGDTYAAVTTYRNAEKTGSPWDVVGTPNTATTASHVLNGITTLTADTLIIASLCGEDNTAATGTTFSATNPTSLSQVLYVESPTGTDGACTAGAAAKAGTGATGNVTATWTATVIGSGGIVLALKPIANTLTIGVTAGSKIATRNSGDVDQFAHDTTCTAPASCAAFTLNVSATSITVTSIKVTETGTAAANTDLSDMVLFFDTDGNWADAGAETQYNSAGASFDATQAATASGSLALTAATTYYFYVRFDVASTTPTYPKGGETVNFQIAANGDVVFTGTATTTGAPVTLAGTTTVLPKIDSTTFGAGLSDGGRSSESITISGKGFGVALAGSRANCAGAVDTGCVRFTVGGAATVADGSVTAWSNTSIAFTIAAALASDGGTAGLEVVAGSQGTATDSTFFIYPKISSLTVPTAVADAAREFDAGDSDGVITANGDHFGTAGTVTIIGSTATQQTTATCTVTAYQATCVGLQVPAAIADTTYTGSIVLTRTSDSKTSTFAGFRVLPRIISNTPSSGIVGDTIQLLGNHFCEGAGCPVSPNRSTVADNVKFGTTQAADADFLNLTGGAGTCNGTGAAWTDTQICVKVPAGTPTGSQPTQITSNTSFTSNTKAFTRLSTVPSDPTVSAPPEGPSRQFKADNTTTIATGGLTNETSINLKADISVGVSSNIRLQIEIQPTGTAFTCTGTTPIGTAPCAAYASGAGALEGTVAGGGGCDTCTSLSQARVTFTGLTDGTKHWQARVRNTGTGEFSNWVSYPNTPSPTNAETATDFQVDATAPTISYGGTNTCNDADGDPGTNTATISFTTNETADSGEVEYSTSATFASGNVTQTDLTNLTSYAFNLTNLNSNTTYFWRVKATDLATNSACRSNGASGTTCPAPSPFCSFITQSVTQPGKTTKFHIVGATAAITVATNYRFDVFVPESGPPSVKSAYVEVTGLVSGGSNPIDLKVNGNATKSFSVSAASITRFKFIYEITNPNTETNLNLNQASPCSNDDSPGVLPENPPCNTLTVTPGTSMTVNITSAKIVVTYGYTP